jgi:hypothetical protein
MAQANSFADFIFSHSRAQRAFHSLPRGRKRSCLRKLKVIQGKKQPRSAPFLRRGFRSLPLLLHGSNRAAHPKEINLQRLAFYRFSDLEWSATFGVL